MRKAKSSKASFFVICARRFSNIWHLAALDEADIQVLKRYGEGPYTQQLKKVEVDIEKCLKRVNELSGIKESDTGLAPPALWDTAADKQAMQHEKPLQVGEIYIGDFKL